MTKPSKKALSELIQWCDKHKFPIVGAIEINGQLVVFGNNADATLKKYKHIEMLVESKGNLSEFVVSLQKEYPSEPSLSNTLRQDRSTKH